MEAPCQDGARARAALASGQVSRAIRIITGMGTPSSHNSIERIDASLNSSVHLAGRRPGPGHAACGRGVAWRGGRPATPPARPARALLDFLAAPFGILARAMDGVAASRRACEERHQYEYLQLAGHMILLSEVGRSDLRAVQQAACLTARAIGREGCIRGPGQASAEAPRQARHDASGAGQAGRRRAADTTSASKAAK